MVNQALFSVFGLIFGETLKDMAGGHATGITLVMAVSVCVTNFSGLLVGPMMKRGISVRTITAFGVLCVGSGMIMSSFATAIWHIVITYGFFTGEWRMRLKSFLLMSNTHQLMQSCMDYRLRIRISGLSNVPGN